MTARFTLHRQENAKTIKRNGSLIYNYIMVESARECKQIRRTIQCIHVEGIMTGSFCQWRTLVQHFIQSQQRIKNFPIDPIAKIARFRQRYNGDLWGNSSSVVESSWNISPQSSSKTLKWSRRIWDGSGKK